MKTQYVRLSHMQVEALREVKAKPKVVKKYKIAEEYLDYSEWWYIVPILCGLGIAMLFIPKLIWLGVILLITGLLFGFFLVKGLMIRASYRSQCSKSEKHGKQYRGRIRAYEVHAKEEYGRRRFSPAIQRPLRPKLKYVLEVEIEGKKKIIRTPKMKYDPTAVLKGDSCLVYQYEDEYYVSGYDLRTSKTDDTAEIPLSKIVIDPAPLTNA